MTPSIRRAAEEAANKHSGEMRKDGFRRGVEWLFQHLCKLADGEFDEKEFIEWFGSRCWMPNGAFVQPSPEDAARHQHSLNHAALLSAKKEIELLHEAAARNGKGAYDKINEQAAEIAQLKLLISKINEKVIPGDTDSIESLRMVFNERDQLRAKVKELEEQVKEACAGRDQWRKTHLENKRLVQEIADVDRDGEFLDLQTKLTRVTEALDVKTLVDKFLGWPLPKGVSPDTQPPDSPHAKFNIGTNLLTADEARQMFEYVLRQALAETERGEK